MAQNHLEEVLKATGLPEDQVKALVELPADAADFKTDGYVAPIRTNVETQVKNDPKFYEGLNKENLPKEFLKTLEAEQYGRSAAQVRSNMLKAVGMTDKDFADLGDDGKKIDVFTPAFVKKLSEGKVTDKELQEKLIQANTKIQELETAQPDIEKKYADEYATKLADFQIGGNVLAHLASVQGWMTGSGGSSQTALMRIYAAPITGSSDAQHQFALDFRESVLGVWRNTFRINAVGTMSMQARTSTNLINLLNSSGLVDGYFSYQHTFGRLILNSQGLSAAPTLTLRTAGLDRLTVGDVNYNVLHGRFSIRDDGDFSANDASAKFEIRSTTHGFLPPRMTAAQRLAIASPATGLMVFDTDSARYFQFKGGAWFGIRYTNESEISSAGTYTPTLTNTTNVTSSTAYDLQYLRVGNTVTVSGKFDVLATADETQTEVGLSLPFASAMTTNGQAGGTGALMNGSDAETRTVVIYSDATNDRATFRFFTPIDGSPLTVHFSFTYQIL